MRASACVLKSKTSRASPWARGPGRVVGPRAQRLALRAAGDGSRLLRPALCADSFAGLGQRVSGLRDRDARRGAGFSARFWRASGLSHGMVVSDRQSARRLGRVLRRAMDAVPLGARARPGTGGLGRSDRLHGPRRRDDRERTSLRRDIGTRWNRAGGRGRDALSRLHRRLVAGGARRRGGRGDFAAPGRRFRRAISLPAEAYRRHAARSRRATRDTAASRRTGGLPIISASPFTRSRANLFCAARR